MAPWTQHLRWIDLQHARMVDLVTTWAEINSCSHHLAGLDRCAKVISRAFAALGGEMRWIDLPPREVVDCSGRLIRQGLGRAIHITKRATAPRTALLAIHYDTVYGAEHPFQHCARIDDHTLRGPGVADAKGGLAVMLVALEALERSDLGEHLGWEVLITPDEEVGSPGSTPLFTEAAGRNQIGMVFEPALPDGSLVGARKGSGNFAAVVTGRAAHAGRDPEKGRNAIHALAQFIVELKQIATRVPGATVNVGMVEGGGPVNVVPDLAIARFNLRINSSDQQKQVEEQLRRIGEAINSADGIHLQVYGSITAPPKPLDGPTVRLFEHVAACGSELGLSLEWRPGGGVCDGNRLAAAGLPTVDTLGPRGGNLHSAEEYLLLDSLTERAKLSALLLFKHAGGELDAPLREPRP